MKACRGVPICNQLKMDLIRKVTPIESSPANATTHNKYARQSNPENLLLGVPNCFITDFLDRKKKTMDRPIHRPIAII